jgi:hypothetical protein
MIASGSASASAGIFECVEEPGTGWTLKPGCLVFGAGGAGEEYTQKEIVGATFSGKILHSIVLKSGGIELKCTASTNEGRVTSKTEEKATIKFTGCKSEPGAQQCKTAGAAAEELLLPASSKIVSLGEPTNLTGRQLLLLVHEPAFECGTTMIHARGSAIGTFEFQDLMWTRYTAKWALNANGEQAITVKEQPLEVNVGSGFERATFKGEVLSIFGLQIEVMG